MANESNTPSQVSYWIDQVKAGDSLATHQLWQHYFERLVRAVGAKLIGRVKGWSDEEDVAISVMKSFYRAAEAGRFPDLTNRDDLWRLLLRMASRKIIDRHRHGNRQRRGGSNLPQSLHKEDSDYGLEAIEVLGNEPSPEMVMSMAETIEAVIRVLGDGQLRELAVGKMEGYSNAELALRFQCSERTIERRLNLIREKCQQELIDEQHTQETTGSDPGKN